MTAYDALKLIESASIRCQDSSVVRFLRIDQMVSGSNPPSLRVRRFAKSL